MHRPGHTAYVALEPTDSTVTGKPSVDAYRAVCPVCDFLGPLTLSRGTARLQERLHRCGALPIVAVES